jgi:hypothetical protein
LRDCLKFVGRELPGSRNLALDYIFGHDSSK